MGARAFVWLGGALFAVSLAVCAWTYAQPMARPRAFGGWPAVAMDAALVTLFALHHSVFARETVKTAMTRVVPPALVRSVYVWIASALLILVCRAWRPVGGEIYAASGAIAIALTAIQLSGLWLTARGVARIDPLELAGIRTSRHSGGLQITGPYHWVRHPLYLGWLLMVFGAPRMTGDRLAFAALTTGYLMIAIPFEERSLRRSFGEDYRRYAEAVRWRMIPFIY